MDAREHYLYVRLLPYVPLGARHSFRVQRWSLRQPQYVGANRQRGAVHTREEVPARRADMSISDQHTLHALRPGIFYDQLSSDFSGGGAQIAGGMFKLPVFPVFSC